MSDKNIEFIPKYIKVIDSTILHKSDWRICCFFSKRPGYLYPLDLNEDKINWSLLNYFINDNHELEKSWDKLTWNKLTWLYVDY